MTTCRRAACGGESVSSAWKEEFTKDAVRCPPCRLFLPKYHFFASQIFQLEVFFTTAEAVPELPLMSFKLRSVGATPFFLVFDKVEVLAPAPFALKN